MIDVANLLRIIRLRCPGGEIGRRRGFKIPRWQHRVGSSPTPGTNKIKHLAFPSLSWFCLLFLKFQRFVHADGGRSIFYRFLVLDTRSRCSAVL